MPGWYFVAQNVAFLLERPQTEYDAITDEAIRQFPHYYEFYFGKITYLMPRWFGNKGDWQKYATEVANTLGPDDGDMFYARALWQMELMAYTEDSLELTDFDWERAKRGFSLLLKDPDSFAVAGAFAQAAWLAKDRKQLKVLFDNNLQNHYDSKVWISEEVFQKAYSWAYANK